MRSSAFLAATMQLVAAHGADAVPAALQRAVEFRRWRAGHVRSIVAAGGSAPLGVRLT